MARAVVQPHETMMDTLNRNSNATLTKDMDLKLERLEDLAGVTGGVLFRLSGAGDTTFARIADEVSAYYLLGFEPGARERDGKRHKIELTTKRPGVLIRARPGFIIDEPDRTGYSWDLPFGAKVIGEVLEATRPLRLLREIRTPLYRIELFRREPRRLLRWRQHAPQVEEHPLASPPHAEAAARILWDGGTPRRLPLGPLADLAQRAEGPAVLRSATMTREMAWQKRYRGGTAGKLWWNPEGPFVRLAEDLDGNLDAPMLVGDRVAFFGINVAVNQSPERVRRFLEKTAVPYQTLYDAEGVSTRAYAAPATSYVVIVDRDGRIAYTGTGGDQDFLPALRQVAAP